MEPDSQESGTKRWKRNCQHDNVEYSEPNENGERRGHCLDCGEGIGWI